MTEVKWYAQLVGSSNKGNGESSDEVGRNLDSEGDLVLGPGEGKMLGPREEITSGSRDYV